MNKIKPLLREIGWVAGFLALAHLLILDNPLIMGFCGEGSDPVTGDRVIAGPTLWGIAGRLITVAVCHLILKKLRKKEFWEMDDADLPAETSPV